MRKIPWQEVRDPRNQSLDPSGVLARSRKQSAWATDDGPTREATKRYANLEYQETGAMRRIFSSTRSWKQSAKGRGPSLVRRKIDFHNMQISDSGYLEKVVQNFKNKVKLAEDAPSLVIQAHETNMLIW